MTLRIAGMGWVTPLGSGVNSVWERLLAGEEAVVEQISSPLNARVYPAFRVPVSATAQLPPHHRLRRASAISRFAVAAGLAALEEAGLTMSAETARRTALIFAIANGGVVYTKRFYHEIVETGAQAASPLLFPETVFNAPASHLAAILGIAGISYTLVGDGAAGLLAMKMAQDLMASETIDQCLIVGAEEADWLLCDAYHRWRLLRDAPPIEPFAPLRRGTILSEGAGAVVLSRSGDVELDRVDAGTNFSRQRDAASCVNRIFQNLARDGVDVVSASANGTFIDAAEQRALAKQCPGAVVYAAKTALGEAPGAGSIWQIICAVQALRENRVPPNLHLKSDPVFRQDKPNARATPFRRAIVSACGMNQQVAGLALSRVG